VLTVMIKPGAWVDPARMLQVIFDAGFTPVPEEVRLVVTGTLSKKGEGFTLAVDGMKAPLELTCVPGAGPGAPDATELSALAGHRVEAGGRWAAAGAGRLELTAIRAISPG
jgi:hypothetical protein